MKEVDFELARQITAGAIARGLIVPAKPEKRQARRLAKKRIKDRRMKRTCPTCHRRVDTIGGNIFLHREREDIRGYGNGDWCKYAEV